MLEKAREALACSPPNFTLHIGDTLSLDPCGLGVYDLVTSRHAPFEPSLVAAVLGEGGCFVTQQVEIDDKRELRRVFGRGLTEPGIERLGIRYAKAFHDLGMAVDVRSYTVAEYYRSDEDLLFLLQNTPIIPDFGKVEGDTEKLAQYVAENRTERGIRATSSRSLLVVVKK